MGVPTITCLGVGIFVAVAPLSVVIILKQNALSTTVQEFLIPSVCHVVDEITRGGNIHRGLRNPSSNYQTGDQRSTFTFCGEAQEWNHAPSSTLTDIHR